MSDTNGRLVSDHHIANLDHLAEKVVRQLQANEWKLLSDELDIAELKALLTDQAELEKVINWLGHIKNRLRPPQIVAPNGRPGGMGIVN